MCLPLELENNSTLHDSSSPMLQLRANIDKQLNC